jgi:hypothetical protein
MTSASTGMSVSTSPLAQSHTRTPSSRGILAIEPASLRDQPVTLGAELHVARAWAASSTSSVARSPERSTIMTLPGWPDEWKPATASSSPSGLHASTLGEEADLLDGEGHEAA